MQAFVHMWKYENSEVWLCKFAFFDYNTEPFVISLKSLLRKREKSLPGVFHMLRKKNEYCQS